MSRIDPSAIPGTELNPDAVLAAADDIARGGAQVRDIGADVVTEWRRLSGHYEAPEAPRLFTAMNPVESRSRQFGDDVERVAAALRSYAEEIRPIKSSLASVRRRAWGFVARTNRDPEWQYKQEMVDENTALVREVNGLQVQLWEAERSCANAIRGLYGAEPWRAATSADDPLGYGISEIPTDADTPWGSEVQRKDHCPKSAGVGVKRFVWDGIVVDGLWGTVTGLGMLVGIDGNGWSWDTMKTSWVGMGSLIGYSGGEWSWGNAGSAWLELGKGIIAYDTWGDDPARAAGGAIFNVATIFIPAGAAVSGTKGAATAAGNGARVSSWLQKGARIVDFTDPVALSVRGARAAMPYLDDLASSLVNLTRGIDIPDLSSALDDVARKGVDDVARGVDDVVDVPPVRDPQTTTPPVRGDGPAGTGSGADPAGSPAPVREPVPVGAGAADAPAPVRGPETPTSSTPGHAAGDAAGSGPNQIPGGGANTPGGTAPTGPGGAGHGADDLVRTPGHTTPDVPPRAPDGGAPGSSTPEPGKAPGAGTGEGPPSSTGGRDSAAPGNAGKLPDGDAGGAPARGSDGPAAPGAGAADELPTSGGPDGDAPPPADRAPEGSETPGGSDARSGVDAPGEAPPARFSDEAASSQSRFEDALARELRDRGMSRGEFDALVSKPPHVLSPESLRTILELREAMPPMDADDIVQKIIPPDVARNSIGPELFDEIAGGELADHVRGLDAQGLSASYEATRVSGYVARVGDTTGLGADELYRALGLDYEGTKFLSDGPVFGVRFAAGDLGEVPRVPTNPVDMLRDAMYQPATDGAAMSRFDQIMSIMDLEARRTAMEGLFHEPIDRAVASGAPQSVIDDLRWSYENEWKGSLTYDNPHRGNGFGGRGPDAVPEFTYVNAHATPPGAELFRVMPDGSEALVAVFDGAAWNRVP